MMTRCTSCGALLGPEADWCGQCYSAVRRSETAQAHPSIAHTPTPAPGVSPNGASASASPALPPRPAAGEPPIPPDLLISLASSRSSSGMALLGRRGRNWITASIVLFAVGTDALFFPYAKYMVIYGVLVGAVAGFALWRLWSVRAVK